MVIYLWPVLICYSKCTCQHHSRNDALHEWNFVLISNDYRRFGTRYHLNFVGLHRAQSGLDFRQFALCMWIIYIYPVLVRRAFSQCTIIRAKGSLLAYLRISSDYLTLEVKIKGASHFKRKRFNFIAQASHHGGLQAKLNEDGVAYRICFMYWNGNMLILMKLLSLAITMTISNATSDENFAKMTIFSYRCKLRGTSLTSVGVCRCDSLQRLQRRYGSQILTF